MANIVSAPPITAEIDHQFSITMYDFSAKGDTPQTLRVGPQGPIGIQGGQEKPTFSFKFFVPATGLEFDWVNILKKPGGFALTFSIGAERHQMVGCRGSSRAINSNPESGDVTYAVDGAATEWLRIA